jgi:hypothetical protein
METTDKIAQLENEIKVLKNEVQAVLLDIRENFLNAENPFYTPKAVATNQQAVIDQNVQTNDHLVEKETKNSLVPPVEEEKPAIEAAEIAPKNDNQSDLQVGQEDFQPTELSELSTPQIPPCESQSTEKQLDLVTFAGLAGWVEESTRRLGKERTEALLDISEATGCLPLNIKKILVKLVNIKPDDYSCKPTSRDYLDSLVKISALLGNKNDSNSALLLVLSQGEERG